MGVVRVVVGSSRNGVVVVDVSTVRVSTVRIVFAHFERVGTRVVKGVRVRAVERGRSRVIKRLRVVERSERVGLFGEEVRFVDGRRLFVNGVYNCCAFDSDFGAWEL